MLACAGGHAEAAELLAERTAQAGLINVQDGSYKRSALHEASHEGLTDTVAKLLSLGADATLTDSSDEFGQTPVDLAGSDEVKAAFAEHTVITDDNKNALLLACARCGLLSLLRVVLQAGANAAHTDENGCTALFLACANTREGAAAELMEATKLAGALDLQDGSYKRSALHEASHEGLTDTVAKLLSLGADATLTDEVRACT